MNTINCEQILLAAMALIDGEESGFSARQIEIHAADCPDCHQEIERMKSVDHLLKMPNRREQQVNLWPMIEPNLITEPKTVPPSKYYLFLLLVVILTVYKLLELIPEDDFGLWFKVIPLILVTALFVFIKENPFKINTELMLEK